MTGALERIVTFIVREKPTDIKVRPVVLDERLLNTPVIAIEQAKREIVRMVNTAKDAVNQAAEGLIH